MTKNFSKIQRINIHYSSLLKCGCNPIALYGTTGNFYKYYKEKTLKELERTNENDERHLNEIGLTIEDICRIEGI